MSLVGELIAILNIWSYHCEVTWKPSLEGDECVGHVWENIRKRKSSSKVCAG